MKHLPALQRTIERFSKRHDLVVEAIGATSDGFYRVELKEPDAEPKPVRGLAPQEAQA